MQIAAPRKIKKLLPYGVAILTLTFVAESSVEHSCSGEQAPSVYPKTLYPFLVDIWFTSL